MMPYYTPDENELDAVDEILKRIVEENAKGYTGERLTRHTLEEDEPGVVTSFMLKLDEIRKDTNLKQQKHLKHDIIIYVDKKGQLRNVEFVLKQAQPDALSTVASYSLEETEKKIDREEDSDILYKVVASTFQEGKEEEKETMFEAAAGEKKEEEEEKPPPKKEKGFENPSLEKLTIEPHEWGKAVEVALDKASKEKERQKKSQYDEKQSEKQKTFEFKPFVIRREILDPQTRKILLHDLIVIPKKKVTEEDYDYEIGMMARPESREEGLLGKGSYGQVALVQWQDGTTSAVKVLSGNDRFAVTRYDPGKRLEDIREQATYKSCKPIYILQQLGRLKAVIGESPEDPHAYIVQERIPGIDMWEYLHRGRLDEHQRCLMALAAARATAELHDKLIIHCDIKPDNFMTTGRKAKAIDFDTSKQLPIEKYQIIDEASGTPDYVAPEIGTLSENEKFIKAPHGGKSSYSKESDIYALGKMFRKDLMLESALSKLIPSMTSENPKDRPAIEEVIIELRNYYDTFWSNYLKTYVSEKAKSLGFCFFRDIRFKII